MTQKPSLSLSSHTSIAEIGAVDWDACASEDNPFVSYGFLSALEESGSVGGDSGWIPQYMAFRDRDGKLAGVAPAYIKLHNYGEYVFDQGWAEAFERAGGAYYPKLQIASPFSPVPGPRLLLRKEAGVSYADLGGGIIQAAARLGLSGAHITFCNEPEWRALGEAGWMQRMGLQFHWHNRNYINFGDFLASLSANHRKNIRRERRDANNCGLTFRILRGDDIKEKDWDAFFRFYHSTVDRKWGSAYLTRGFFSRLSQKLGDKVVLMLAAQGATPVAGALNILGGDTLYGRNWGCIGDFPFLHFELCYYRAIDFAIENKLASVQAGAQGEHKIQRGYLPQPTYSLHWLAHRGLAQAVGDFLTRERHATKGDIATLSGYAPFRQAR